MTGFPSPEVARAVEASKDFLEWMVDHKIQDFEEAWGRCRDGRLMYRVLLTLNPQFKNLQWVSFRAALRTVQAENMDLDEQLLDHLARKRAALESGSDNYDHEAAIARAIALNRIITADDAPRAKGQANLTVGWACCKDARSCGMALKSAVGAERFRFFREQEITDDTVFYQPQEPRAQANDIRELFPLPLTMSGRRYLSRYERPWVI